MPRSSGFYVENDLTGGMVTDFSGLNFPEKSAVDADNVIFTEKSRVDRRLGFDYEVDKVFNTVTRDNGVVSSYLWRSVGGNGDLNFTVVQVSNQLYFYLVGASSLSSGKHPQSIDLSTYLVLGGPSTSFECQFASGDGKLFVTHPYADPFYIEYSSETDTFTSKVINIQIRDFEGVVDGLAIDYRPNTLSKEHKYNLYNQGWYTTAACYVSFPAITEVVLNNWDRYRGDFPSNSDVWQQYKGPTNNANIVGELFSVFYIDYYGLGNSPAPKGHYILDLHYQDRAALSGISGIPVKSTGYNRVSTVGFFAGRVWYAGISTPGFNQKLYFTQIIERDTQYGQCYQLNDPTSEVTFDLLATDGGVISITDAGTILKLVTLDNTLLVFATNGIWAITGSQGIGFTATDYSVNKISSLTVLNTSSFLNINGVPAWMNTEGIYVVRRGQNGLEVQSLTDLKFKKFMDTIPNECKKYARGAFNPYSRVIQWLYRSTIPTTINERYEFDKVLNINIVSNSFYPWTISNSNVTVNGLLVVDGDSVLFSEEPVYDNNGVTVTTNTLEPVTTITSESQGIEPTFKYIVTVPSGANHNLTFAETLDTSYRDWVSYSPVDYSSTFTWGYKVQGEGIKKLQVTYLEVYTDNETPSTFDVQSVWDYATIGDTGRWSVKQRCSTNLEDYSFYTFRRKLRGHGKAAQIKISSVSGRPFSIVGFASWITANQRP